MKLRSVPTWNRFTAMRLILMTRPEPSQDAVISEPVAIAEFINVEAVDGFRQVA